MTAIELSATSMSGSSTSSKPTVGASTAARGRSRLHWFAGIPVAVILGSTSLLMGFGGDVVSAGVDVDGGERDGCDTHIVPQHQRVDGRTQSEWSAAWWQWATAFDVPQNPVIDPDGTNAGVGQSGPVWFLAGTFGGAAVRNVTIPSDKHIFVPLTNAEWDTMPGFTNPLGLPDPLSVQDIRAITAFFVENADVTCEIDGCEVRRPERYRARSPVFSMNFEPNFAIAFGYPAAYVRTAVSDGYWVMLRPLSPGAHVIHFTSNNPVLGFSLDVTYNVTVTP